MKTNILVTGATGFVGRQLVHDLLSQDNDVDLYLVSRNDPRPQFSASFKAHTSLHFIPVASIEQLTPEQLPDDIDVVVHLAAKAHVVETDALSREYQQINVEGTKAVAQVAVQKKAKHFIYVSSIKVNGDETCGKAFNESDEALPNGVYASTKYEAEQYLQALASESLRVSTVRPPLVYGKGVKANMSALVTLVRFLPLLPFGAVKNRRSLISLGNLTHFIKTLIWKTPEKDYQHALFLVSDKEAVSTAQLCINIAKALGKRIYMLPVPPVFLSLPLRLIGKAAMWNKLAGSLEVKGQNAVDYYQWVPPHSMVDELAYLKEDRI